MRRARSALEESCPYCMDNSTEDDLNSIVGGVSRIGGTRGITNLIYRCLSDMRMSEWKKLHDRTEEERWESFRSTILTDDHGSKIAAHDKTTRKAFRKMSKLEDSEMCSNCFVLEQELFHEGSEGLLKCSRCSKIKYCSKECQREHWKKAHKNHCKKVEKAASSLETKASLS